MAAIVVSRGVHSDALTNIPFLGPLHPLKRHCFSGNRGWVEDQISWQLWSLQTLHLRQFWFSWPGFHFFVTQLGDPQHLIFYTRVHTWWSEQRPVWWRWRGLAESWAVGRIWCTSTCSPPTSLTSFHNVAVTSKVPACQQSPGPPLTTPPLTTPPLTMPPQLLIPTQQSETPLEAPPPQPRRLVQRQVAWVPALQMTISPSQPRRLIPKQVVQVRPLQVRLETMLQEGKRSRVISSLIRMCSYSLIKLTPEKSENLMKIWGWGIGLWPDWNALWEIAFKW